MQADGMVKVRYPCNYICSKYHSMADKPQSFFLMSMSNIENRQVLTCLRLHSQIGQLDNNVPELEKMRLRTHPVYFVRYCGGPSVKFKFITTILTRSTITTQHGRKLPIADQR